MKATRNFSKMPTRTFIATLLVAISLACAVITAYAQNERKDKKPSVKDIDFAINLMVEQLGSEKEFEVLQAIKLISGLGDAALPYLIRGLKHKTSPRVRSNSAVIVGFIGSQDRRIYKALQEAFKDPVAHVRYNAIIAFAKVAYPDDLSAVLDLNFISQSDTDKDVRDAASGAAWHILHKKEDFVNAAYTGDVKKVRALLKEVSVNTRDKYKQTALIAASAGGHYGIVELLLDKGADINIQDDNGMSAFMWSSRRGDLDIVKLLLAGGANTNDKSNDGRTALIQTSLYDHPNVVKLLLQNGAVVDAADNAGLTALIIASEKGHEDIARILLDSGVNVHAKTNDGWTALLMASFYGHKSIVKMLLGKGSDVNAKANRGETSLILSAQKGHTEIVKLLIAAGANVNVTGEKGWTALIAASNDGHFEVVKILIANGADVNAKTKYGGTALDYAQQNNHAEIIRVLLEALGIGR